MTQLPDNKKELAKVHVGYWVAMQDVNENKSVTYKIVPPDRADPDKGRISMLSPLGAALMEHQAGDLVRFQACGATRTVRILNVLPVQGASKMDDGTKNK